MSCALGGIETVHNKMRHFGTVGTGRALAIIVDVTGHGTSRHGFNGGGRAGGPRFTPGRTSVYPCTLPYAS